MELWEVWVDFHVNVAWANDAIVHVCLLGHVEALNKISIFLRHLWDTYMPIITKVISCDSGITSANIFKNEIHSRIQLFQLNNFFSFFTIAEYL